MKKIFTILLLALALSLYSGAVTVKAAEDTVVKIEKDICYNSSAKEISQSQMLDVYHVEGKTDLPVLVFIHGGSWNSGSKEMAANLAKTMAKKEIVTVVINYRLGPAYEHPQQVHDAARAFAWTYSNIKDYGGDPKRIFLGGHSAGAHLASLLILDKSYFKRFNVPEDAVYGSVLISGIYWLAYGSRPWSVDRNSSLMKAIEPVFGNTVESLVEASPMAHKRPDISPMLILYGQLKQEWLPFRPANSTEPF